MSHPLRIRWHRGMGKLPAGAKLVTRASRWGNPFVLIEHGGTYTRAESLWLYEHEHLPSRPDLLAQLPELAGRRLACSCRLDEDCHADVLCRLANADDAA
jgi:hypothetical protein